MSDKNSNGRPRTSRKAKVSRREFLKTAAASEVRLSALAGGTTAIGLKAMDHQGLDKKNGFKGEKDANERPSDLSESARRP